MWNVKHFDVPSIPNNTKGLGMRMIQSFEGTLGVIFRPTCEGIRTIFAHKRAPKTFHDDTTWNKIGGG